MQFWALQNLAKNSLVTKTRKYYLIRKCPYLPRAAFSVPAHLIQIESLRGVLSENGLQGSPIRFPLKRDYGLASPTTITVILAGGLLTPIFSSLATTPGPPFYRESLSFSKFFSCKDSYYPAAGINSFLHARSHWFFVHTSLQPSHMPQWEYRAESSKIQ